MNYTVRGQFNTIKVFNDDEGEVAYRLFCVGLAAQAGATLFNETTGRYDVGMGKNDEPG